MFIKILLFIFLFTIFLKYKPNSVKENYTKYNKIEELKNILKPMFQQSFNGKLKKLNDIDIFKDINIQIGNKSYTINKKDIYLCMYDENNKFYENQQLIYVLLHEISHVICDDIGHTDDFFEIFDELLNIAIRMKIYDPEFVLKEKYCT
jgi:hypothetical protein